MFFRNKHSKVAVLLHDGGTWFAFAFRFERRIWRCYAQTTLNGKSPRRIPPELLTFAETNHCLRVRLVLPRQIHTLTTELPPDITAEEIQTLLVSEASQITGSEFGSVRIAAVKADHDSMSGLPNTIFAAEFEQAALQQYQQQCRQEQLRFDGCAALELTTLAVHSENTPEKRFLFLRQESGFYYVGASDVDAENGQPTTVVNIAVGSQNFSKLPEKSERLRKRLDLHKNIPIEAALCYTEIDEEYKAKLRTLVSEETEAEFIRFADIAEAVARRVAEITPTNEDICPLVSLGEEVTDPHYAGTYILVASLLIAIVLTVGGRWKLQNDLKMIETRAAAWNKLQEERKKVNDKLADIDARRSKCDKVIALLNDKSRTPPGLMKILTELSQNIPAYTKIEAIEQKNGQGKNLFEIRGRTIYQDGLLQFCSQFNNELAGISCNLELKEFEKAADNPREQLFVFWVNSTR
ncbi:MAG: hypothetical protein LBT05_01610 [Planctomycetaceae bacterium]|jgi:hypothetical protein|nr:hypothetical protein [Planctomycetaceae bacterium]